MVLASISPPRAGLKRKASSPRSLESKRRRIQGGKTRSRLNHFCRPRKPVGEPWPVHDLRAFDAPTEYQSEINYGPMLRHLLRERGWRYSTKPCHGTFDEETGT